MRSRVVSWVVAALVAVPGVGVGTAGAVPAAPEDAGGAGLPGAPVWPGGALRDVALTEGALYLSAVTDGRTAYPVIHRRDLHDTVDGVVLGNVQVVGWAQVDLSGVDRFGGLASSDEAAVWLSGPWGLGIDVLGDDRQVTEGPQRAAPPVSLADGWFTSTSTLWSLDGAVQHDLGAVALPPAPAGYTGAAPVVHNAHVGEGVVAWFVEYRHDTDVSLLGGRLVAARLGDDGAPGTPVVLEERFGQHAEGFRVPSVDIDDGVLAWSSWDVAWVPTADLAVEPSTVDLGGSVWSVSTDAGRIAAGGGSGGWEDHQPFLTVFAVADPATPLWHWEGAAGEHPEEQVQEVHLEGELLLTQWWTGDEDVAHLVALDGDEISEVPDFPDVTSHNPLVPDIDWLVMEGITTGYEDGLFRPYAPVTRQAMAAFLHRAAGSPAWTPPAESPFADLAPGSPFYAEITWMHAEGITTGYDGPGGSLLFRPATTVSRQAMAAFLHRFAEVPPGPGPAASPFLDVPVGADFSTEIIWLAEQGISTGTDIGGAWTFRPADPVSRQAMAAFLHRLDDVVAPA